MPVLLTHRSLLSFFIYSACYQRAFRQYLKQYKWEISRKWNTELLKGAGKQCELSEAIKQHFSIQIPFRGHFYKSQTAEHLPQTHRECCHFSASVSVATRWMSVFTTLPTQQAHYSFTNMRILDHFSGSPPPPLLRSFIIMLENCRRLVRGKTNKESLSRGTGGLKKLGSLKKT